MRDTLKAEQTYQQAIGIQKASSGEKNSEYARYLNSLGVLYFETRQYDKAEAIYQQVIAIRKEILGEKHPDYATSLDRLGSLYHLIGKFAEARANLLEALEIRRVVFGVQHATYAQSLNNVGSLLSSMGNYSEAAHYYRQASEIAKVALGEKHQYYAAGLRNLATVLQSMGDYEQAEPLFRQAIAITKEALGEKHPEYARSLNNLAGLFVNKGEYEQAEPLYQDAIRLRREAVGEKHRDYGEALNNLGVLYQSMGDYSLAERHYLQALAARTEKQRELSFENAKTLNNLAQLYLLMRDYERAEQRLSEVATVRKQILTERHPQYAETLSALSALYCQRAEFEKAEALAQQAEAILRESLGEKHPLHATSLSNLARVYQGLEQFQKAERLFQQSKDRIAASLGERHPIYANCLRNFSLLFQAMGKPKEAESLAYEAFRITHDRLGLLATVQSERQQLRMADDVRLYLDNWLSSAKYSGVPANRVCDVVLTWKGCVSARQQLMRQMRRNHHDDDVSRMYRELTEAAHKLEKLSWAPISLTQTDQYRTDLFAASEKLETLQKKISAASVEFRRISEQQRRDSAVLLECLPKDTVLVDLLVYYHFEAGPKGNSPPDWKQRLAAFILSKGRPIEWVDLGPLDPIVELVERWRMTYSEGVGRELRRLAWEPIEVKLGDSKTVLISPDGALARLPWNALPGKSSGTYLIEDLAIATVAIPRLLPETLAVTKSQSEPSLLMVGDIDFMADATGKVPNEHLAMSAPRNRSGNGWQFEPLQGTRDEALAINEAFQERFPNSRQKYLSRAEPTRQVICASLQEYGYVHLATHGFFAPPEVGSALNKNSAAAKGGSVGTQFGPEEAVGYHPDLLVGVALAGASQRVDTSQSDGILTAKAVQELDLSRVQLATLSACETGLGKSAGGEGVLGLQRAFQLAGARTSICSLWRVDDAATKTLMVEFYKRLWDKKHPVGKLEALRQAQLTMLKHYDVKQMKIDRGLKRESPAPENVAHRLSPKYWAAFVLSGDWR